MITISKYLCPNHDKKVRYVGFKKDKIKEYFIV